MSREIKFRAWNKEEKTMCTKPYDSPYALEVGSINDYLKQPEYFKEYEYMQYIGIEDKNKNEIYENDIVKIDGKRELFIVVWVCDTARFGLQSKEELLYFELGIGSRIEVIGNKYENPELAQN